jgi:DNA-directed RNA polymerase subunit beta'
VREPDCGSSLGLWLEHVAPDTANKRAYLETKLFGRALSQDVTMSDGSVIPRNTIIGDIEMAALRDDPNVNRVRIRSVLTCDAELGVCAFATAARLPPASRSSSARLSASSPPSPSASPVRS